MRDYWRQLFWKRQGILNCNKLLENSLNLTDEKTHFILDNDGTSAEWKILNQ